VTATLESSFDFANLQGLAALRTASDSPEAREIVAKQFESLFLNLMIRQMRSAGSAIDGGLIDKERIEFHQGLFDQQLALNLSKGRGIGLAESIMRSFGETGVEAKPSSEGSMLPLGPAQRARTSLSGIRPLTGDAAAVVPGFAGQEGAIPSRSSDRLTAETPDEFVVQLWPHAARAARELGVIPDVLVAQAALETGWGSSLPRNQYGESSLNLFGIKAGSDWTGARAVVTTLEFVNGVPEQRREPFRMYRSLAHSFDDYVAVVRGRPRYAEALEAGTPEDYFRGLQEAGYATDPEYADKLIGILARGLPGRDRAIAESDAVQVFAARADKPEGGTPTDAAADGDRL